MKEFVVGKVFAEKSELFSFFEEYFQQTYQPFIRHVITNKNVVFRCAHWRLRKSQSKGERPKQHYLFTGCNARINLYKGKENYWKVTLVELGHNHTIGKEEFSLYRRRTKLTQQDFKLISNLVQAKVKDSVVADVLKTKRDKFLTRKDVTNIRAKLLTLSSKAHKGVESKPAEGITFRNKNTKLDGSLSNSGRVKFLTKNEKCRIATEFFSRHADKLSNLGTNEFFEHMEELQNILECSYDKVLAFAPVSDPSLEVSSVGDSQNIPQLKFISKIKGRVRLKRNSKNIM